MTPTAEDKALEAIKAQVRAYLQDKTPSECAAFCRLIYDEHDPAQQDNSPTWLTVPAAEDSPLDDVVGPDPAVTEFVKKSGWGFCCGRSGSDVAGGAASSSDAAPLVARVPPPNLQIDHKQVDELVTALLKDPQFDSSIPDVLEKLAYTMAVDEALKCICDSVLGLHGTDVLGCHVRVLEKDSKVFAVPKITVDRRPIAELVDELLRDQDINLSFLPDSLEAKLYVNAVVLALSVMQIFLLQNQFNIYGHTLGGNLTPIPATILASPSAVATRWKKKENGRAGAGDKIKLSPAEMDEEVDRLLGTHGRHSLTDEFTVRPVAKAMVRLVHRLAQEFLKGLSVNVFGNVVRFKLVRGRW